MPNLAAAVVVAGQMTQQTVYDIGAITFVTFRSMGARLADVFEQNLKGEFVAEGGMELRAEVLATDSAEEEPLS